MTIYLQPDANRVLLGQALGQMGQNLVAGYLQKAEQMKEATDMQTVTGWLGRLKDDPNTPAPTGMITQKGNDLVNKIVYETQSPSALLNYKKMEGEIGESAARTGLLKAQSKMTDIKLSGQPTNLEDFGTGLEKIANPKMRQMYIDKFLPQLDPEFARSRALAEQAYRTGTPTIQGSNAIEDFKSKYSGLYESYKTSAGFDTAEEALASNPIGPDGKPLLVKSVRQGANGRFFPEFGDRTAGMGSQTSQFLPGAGTFQMPDPNDPTKMVPAAINKITLKPEPMVGIERQPQKDIMKQKEVRGLDDFNDKLVRIDALYANHKDYVGPVANIKKGIQEKYTGNLKDEENEFRQLVKELSDDLLRLRSGAQINEQEYQRMLSFLPTTNLPSSTFTSRLNSVRKTINQKLQSRETVPISKPNDDLSNMSDEELKRIINGGK